MKNQAAKLISRTVIVMLMLSLAFNLFPQKTARAADNLLKGGTFETDVYANWGIWQNSQSRKYNFYRSYDSALGQGSYSAAIEATGQPEARTNAGLVGNSNSSFIVEPGKNYLFRFYAKASQASKVSVYLENAGTYAVITPLTEQNITQDWQVYNVIFNPNVSSSQAALLVIAFGDLPAQTTLNLDSLALLNLNTKLSTTEVRGYIGENKTLAFNDLSNISDSEIKIGLPYYDATTGATSIKKFSGNVSGNSLNFALPTNTYAGIGKVYIYDNLVGQFNYNLLPKIIEFYPSTLRTDDDLSLRVSGFNPLPNASYIVLNTIDTKGKIYQSWLTAHDFDSQLTYVTVKLPTGVVAGSMFMQTSFQNSSNVNVENRTNSMSYKIKPVIFSTEWSKRGYEQVGDKIKIHGKGIAHSPTVNFYDGNSKLISSRGASVVSIDNNEEVIEVVSPTNATQAIVRVKVDGIESDSSQSLTYYAKPRLNVVSSASRRIMKESGESLPAAKIGEEITLLGSGFKADDTSVEFQAFGQRANVPIIAGKINADGTSLKVTVPASAQTGFLSVKANSQVSNYLPLEIIPKIINVSPDPVQPGGNLNIQAQGVGSNLNLLKVVFNLTSNEKLAVAADSLILNGDTATITLKAPLAISNRYSSINIIYDHWQDNGNVYLKVNPVITDANINLDTGILTIKGYGFSIKANENIVTYKYADQNRTVINPRVQMIGVYPAEDGQEIRFRILDDYHYGYVSVKVGDYQSNEENFGPVSISKIVRRVEFVKSFNEVKGVLYIFGYNFGSKGDVKVGSEWASTQYRSDFFIIAVVDKNNVYGNPVIITKQ